MKKIVGRYFSERQEYFIWKSGIFHFEDARIGEAEVIILKLFSLRALCKIVHRSSCYESRKCQKVCSTRRVEGNGPKLYETEFSQSGS